MAGPLGSAVSHFLFSLLSWLDLHLRQERNRNLLAGPVSRWTGLTRLDWVLDGLDWVLDGLVLLDWVRGGLSRLDWFLDGLDLRYWVRGGLSRLDWVLDGLDRVIDGLLRLGWVIDGLDWVRDGLTRLNWVINGLNGKLTFAHYFHQWKCVSNSIMSSSDLR